MVEHRLKILIQRFKQQHGGKLNILKSNSSKISRKLPFDNLQHDETKTKSNLSDKEN